MRVTQASVQQHAGKSGDEIATMAAIRKEKDSFKWTSPILISYFKFSLVVVLFARNKSLPLFIRA